MLLLLSAHRATTGHKDSMKDLSDFGDLCKQFKI